MQKKWTSYVILVVILCAVFWSIYSNFFLSKLHPNQSIANGSHDIELAEGIQTEETENPENTNPIHKELENEFHHDHNVNENSHDDHVHDESLTESHSDHDGHLHDINTTEIVDVSNPATNFVTKTLNGETVQLSDFLGKRVILNFWTTWCPPCQEEIPELQKFHDSSSKTDEVVLLGINITNEDLGINVIHDFRDYYGITYPILLDQTGQITDSYEIITIPTTFIIDEKGNLEKEILGPLTNTMLEELLTK